MLVMFLYLKQFLKFTCHLLTKNKSWFREKLFWTTSSKTKTKYSTVNIYLSLQYTKIRIIEKLWSHKDVIKENANQNVGETN